MHIKAVKIVGFKTHKKTNITNLDKSFNLILGRNGSGKSNILDAIQFVLSDRFSNLSMDAKTALMHIGSGSTSHARVDIVFDNSDRRFPVEEKEVVIGRSIHSSKDEYFLHGVPKRKNIIMDWLESAGFSRSNPYNMVQQGKVSELTNMSAAKRLELLKDIAGTRTYDDKRKESLKIMKDTDTRRDRIKEVIEDIDQRLGELEEEMADLTEYQKLDGERRCLEYTIYNQELKVANEKLEELEESREQRSKTADEVHSIVSSAKKERGDKEEEIKALSLDVDELSRTAKRLAKEVQKALHEHAQAELAVTDAEDTHVSGKEKRASAEELLRSIEHQIETKQAELSEVSAKYQALVAEEAEKTEACNLAEQEVQQLHAIQGRAAQFTSRKARDKYLKSQIKEVQSKLSAAMEECADLEKENARLKKEGTRNSTNQKKQEAKLQEMHSHIDELGGRMQEAIKRRNEATEKRKELWKSEADVEKARKSAKAELDKTKRHLETTMDKDVVKGLQTIRRLVQQHNIKGYHGTLLDLFDCSYPFNTCVEVVGGNSLFNVVVDDDKTAAKLINLLNMERGGRVTFVPLNKIRTQERDYPQTSEAFPLIQKLIFDSKFRKAMLQVFGKTMVVRNLEVGSQLARNNGLNAVTLEGDQVSKKGAITGGFLDHKYSRVALQKEILAAEKSYNASQRKADSIKQQIKDCDQEITKLLSETQKLATEKTHLRQQVATISAEVELEKKNKSIREKDIQHNETRLRNLQSSIRQDEARVIRLQDEMKTDISEDLNTQDQETLSAKTAELKELKQEVAKLVNTRTDVEIAKTQLERELNDNLLKQQAELRQQCSSQAYDEVVDELETMKEKLVAAKDVLEDLNIQRKAIDSELDAKNARLEDIKGRVEQLKSIEAEHERVFASESKNMEKLHNKRSMLHQKRVDCNKKIMELGGIPTGVQKYSKKSTKDCMHQLERVNKKLKQYSHVNKKAIEQWTKFKDERKAVVERHKELDESRESILKLIDSLDQKKDDAIQRTFKMIAKQFSKVFKEIVPDGNAKLVILRKDPEELPNQEAGAAVTTESYAGIDIEVSFSGRNPQDLRHMSGGQRTVVSLCLIFAIQRVDPSPFYIMDEIDSALDPQHRTTVAQMIARQATRGEEPIQFICTTQNREMIATAQRFIAVSFENRASKVSVINKEAARDLMQQIETEGK